MSTRWYPLYQKGNPQLRVFLPNFWLKLIQPKVNQPENVVVFQCSIEMTTFDIQNYLSKIYDVHPIKVNTRIALGNLRKCPKQKCIIKDDDFKVAYVILPKDQVFTYPNLFPPSDEKSQEDRMEESKQEFKQFVKPNTMPCLPSWFRM